jgi:hypothetical protein
LDPCTIERAPKRASTIPTADALTLWKDQIYPLQPEAFADLEFTSIPTT